MTVNFETRRNGRILADDLFVNRWSPRSFTNEKIPESAIEKIIDAARFAPSCYNEQPWRFVLSTEGTFDQFLNLLVPANQSWCKNASHIGFILATKTFQQNSNPNPWNHFDAGSAWMNLNLQAELMGYSVHGLGGILKDKVQQYFSIDPKKYDVICGFVIGKRGEVGLLDKDLQQKEAPSGRLSLKEILNFGSFDF